MQKARIVSKYFPNYRIREVKMVSFSQFLLGNLCIFCFRHDYFESNQNVLQVALPIMQDELQLQQHEPSIADPVSQFNSWPLHSGNAVDLQDVEHNPNADQSVQNDENQ
uniref:Uncharacterized protein n=1 Tax=Cacopsylla melanoneura TaxID=428564 RepID=A0A8D8XHH6_9HEMI